MPSRNSLSTFLRPNYLDLVWGRFCSLGKRRQGVGRGNIGSNVRRKKVGDPWKPRRSTAQYRNVRGARDDKLFYLYTVVMSRHGDHFSMIRTDARAERLFQELYAQSVQLSELFCSSRRRTRRTTSTRRSWHTASNQELTEAKAVYVRVRTSFCFTHFF